MLRSCVIAAALFAFPGAAGSPDPVYIRTVTIDGVVGAAYYSTVEQGFRFVGGSPSTSLASVDAPIDVSSLDATGKKTAASTAAMPESTILNGDAIGSDDHATEQGS